MSHENPAKHEMTTFPPVEVRPSESGDASAIVGEGQTIGRTAVHEAAAANVADFAAVAARVASGVPAASLTSAGPPGRDAAAGGLAPLPPVSEAVTVEAATPDVPVTIQAQPTPAAAHASPPDNLPTQEAVPLDHYLLLELIGHGGMGDVYKARDSRDNSIVAIKRMQKRFAEEERYRRQFIKEARHMQAMQHPNILAVHDVMEHSPRPYYVMPYLGGGSLTTLRKRHPAGILPPPLAPQVLLPIADALQYAHDKRGVIHRDIKPENVLFDEAGRPFVCDFGLVRTVFNDTIVPDQPQMSWTVGTLAYMAPEVVAGNAGDVRVDVYSFGAMMYELLTGRRPYPGGDVADLLNQIRKSPPMPAAKVNPALPAPWVTVIEGAMARQLSARYAHMGDVQRDLDRLAKGGAPLGPRQDPTLVAGTQRLSTTAIPRVAAPSRGRRPLVAAVMVLAVAACAVIWAWAEGAFAPDQAKSDPEKKHADDAGGKMDDKKEPGKPDPAVPAPQPPIVVPEIDPLETKEHVVQHPRPYDPAALLVSLRRAVTDGNAAQARADLKALAEAQVATYDLIDADAAGTPLIIKAMQLNQRRVVKVMIQEGVLQGAMNQQGQQLIHAAAQHGAADVIRAILAARPTLLVAETPDGMLPVHLAAQAGQVDVLRLLAGKDGAALLAKNPLNHSTPLHEAARNGQAAAVEYLLSLPAVAKANLNAKDNKGRAPLHYAAEKGHVDVIKLLLSSGADRTITNAQGETPLDLAREHLKAAAVELLGKP